MEKNEEPSAVAASCMTCNLRSLDNKERRNPSLNAGEQVEQWLQRKI